MVNQQCGVIAIVGRPNVGKSTLLNHLLGQKLSITSRKPQTTRNQVLGVRTVGAIQFVFVDTPGLHLGQNKAINQAMNKAASSAMSGVDLVLFLCDRTKWTEEDEYVLGLVSQQSSPVALIVNKVDLIQDHATMLPFIEELSSRCAFDAALPVSALRRHHRRDPTKLVIDADYNFEPSIFSSPSLYSLHSEVSIRKEDSKEEVSLQVVLCDQNAKVY